MSIKSALRKMNRAFQTKDDRHFDEAMEELEENLEKDESPEEAVEIHNHIPDMRDTARGEFPDKGGETVSSPAFDEEPPWFKAHKEATDAKFKAMKDSFEDFIKGKKGEEEEAEDRRRNDSRHRDEEDPEEKRRREEEEGQEDRHDNEEENLEMDRGRDRHDRRDYRNDDEANKEILGELEFEAPPGTGDRAYKGKGKDSAFLEDVFQDAIAKAEVIVPGIRLPTFDRKADPRRTMGSIVKLRKTALDLAYNQPATRGVIDQAMSGKTMDSKRMKAATTRVLFNSIAGAVASQNNSRATDTRILDGGHRSSSANGARIQSISDINKVNRETYAAKR